MATKPGRVSEDLAKRMAAATRWVESERRKKKTTPRRLPLRGDGFWEVGAAVLSEDLDAEGHATATLLRQNTSTAAFSPSEADDAEIEIYDSLKYLSAAESEYLAEGCWVFYWRNPATGFYNLVGSPCCPTTGA